MFATYFNAGVRVYDVSRRLRPRGDRALGAGHARGQEAPQINDLFVAKDGLIYVTDRVTGGVYVLEPDTDLLARMREEQLD